MSLSWPEIRLADHYVAVLTPAGASIIRRRRGINGSCDLKADQAVADGTAGGEHPAGVLAAVDALEALLAHPQIGSGRLSIVLSNHFVRYQLVPWSDDVGTPEELNAYARICFEQVYGGEAVGWQVQVAPERAGSPRLAAAVPLTLLDRLRAIVAPTRLKLHAVQPYLMAAFNKLGSPFRYQDFLFVLAEPARTCLLAATGGQWRGVRMSAGDDAPETLAALIERECQLLDLHDAVLPPIYVHAPQRARMVLPAVAGVVPRALPVPVPASLAAVADARLAMAMTVA